MATPATDPSAPATSQPSGTTTLAPTAPTPQIISNLRTIGGDRAVELAQMIAKEKAMQTQGQDPLNKRIENNFQNAAITDLSNQLKTTLNEGVQNAAGKGQNGALFPQDVTDALNRINPQALNAAQRAGYSALENPNNPDQGAAPQLKELATDLVDKGVKTKANMDIIASSSPPSTTQPASVDPKLMQSIQTIGGDKAEKLAEMLAAEDRDLKPQAQDPLNRNFETNQRNAATVDIANQLRTAMNEGVQNAAGKGENGALLPKNVVDALNYINPASLNAADRTALSALADPKNPDQDAVPQLTELANDLVKSGVRAHIGNVSTSDLQQPNPVPGQQTGPQGPAK